ncbi:DUF3375 domain-containing protein [Leucobacter aridicollis]|uniref:DNA-binding transcriptional MerR regulator n=1 Tax=Leucobacter aridicollis TaxID=283878 RepID=A0A852RCN4_9MICO|nr:DUF3375 domain-containing protein [Leucobacter aridicollis]MBL3683751.1 DUF3375 domain-containing protein [Leucobacter aridicollis]NYD26640.1 DNA-binding transcriptional MerR regulator [Leucobacter aridicollis]
MTSSRSEIAFQRALAAFKNPTLDLLHGRYAPFVVSVLSGMFTAERQSVPISDAHVEVGNFADELRAAGYDDEERRLPSGSGRDICRYWARVGWLVPQIQDGVELYRLSAQAVGALEIAGRAGGGRAKVSRSRVRTLLESVEQLTQSAETDPVKRIERLRAERAEIDAELARLEDDDDAFDPVDDEQLLEDTENVLHLSRELPADFVRVAESINAMQRDVIAELRRDERPTGDVLREYLRRGEHVMDATPEGRAFAGALKLIGDPVHIEELTEQLQSILGRPFARLMSAEQRADLRAIAKRVEQGVEEVLTAQRRASHIITTQVRTHDPIRDREVDSLLRSVMAGLQAWVPESNARDRVEPLRALPSAAIHHLRQTVSDPRPPNVPAPLSEAADARSTAEFVDADTRAWGGPNYVALEAYVAGLPGDDFDLAEAFDSIDDTATRRPADLLGMLELAHRAGMTEGETVSTVEAIRPDGTARTFAFAAVTARTPRDAAVPADAPVSAARDAATPRVEPNE